MSAPQPTERWSDRTYTPQSGATRSFDVPGYANMLDAMSVAVGNFGLRVGSPHPNDSSMFVTMGSLSGRNNGGPTTWIVTVAYKYLEQFPAQDGPPLERATRWEITPGLESDATDVDAYGNNYANSAGTPFEPKAQRTISTLQIAAYRYYPSFVIATAIKYMNKINSNPINISGLGALNPYKMKCLLIAPTGQIISGQTSPIEVVHRFEVRSALVSGDEKDPAWRLRVLDKGTLGWYSDGGTTKMGPFTIPDPSSNGTMYIDATNDVLLDGTGKPIDPNVRVGRGPAANVKSPISNPVQLGKDVIVTKGAMGSAFLNFRVENTIDFGPLLAGL